MSHLARSHTLSVATGAPLTQRIDVPGDPVVDNKVREDGGADESPLPKRPDRPKAFDSRDVIGRLPRGPR